MEFYSSTVKRQNELSHSWPLCFSRAESPSPPHCLNRHTPCLRLWHGWRAFRCFLVPVKISSGVLLNLNFSPFALIPVLFILQNTSWSNMVKVLFLIGALHMCPVWFALESHHRVIWPLRPVGCLQQKTAVDNGSRKMNPLEGHLVPTKVPRRSENRLRGLAGPERGDSPLH